MPPEHKKERSRKGADVHPRSSVLEYAKALVGMKIAQYFPDYGEGEREQTLGKYGYGVFEGILHSVLESNDDDMKDFFKLRTRPLEWKHDVRKIWLHLEYEDGDSGDLYLEAVVGVNRTAKRDATGRWIIDAIILRDDQQPKTVVECVSIAAEANAIPLDRSAGDTVRQFARMLHVREECICAGAASAEPAFPTGWAALVNSDRFGPGYSACGGGLGPVPNGSQYADAVKKEVARNKKLPKTSAAAAAAAAAATPAASKPARLPQAGKSPSPSSGPGPSAPPARAHAEPPPKKRKVWPCSPPPSSPPPPPSPPPQAVPAAATGSTRAGGGGKSTWLLYADAAGRLLMRRRLRPGDPVQRRILGLGDSEEQADGCRLVRGCSRIHVI
jgi:hypothetical protein